MSAPRGAGANPEFIGWRALSRHRAQPMELDGILFRGDVDLRRRGLHFGVYGLLELREVLLEHANELARSLVEYLLVGPGSLRIEQIGIDTRHRGRNREAK